MAPSKKKRKPEQQCEEILERFKDLRLLIIPPADRGLDSEVAVWRRNIGDSFTVVTKKQALPKNKAWTHIVVGPDWTESLQAKIQDVAKDGAKVVTFQWFDESLRGLPRRAETCKPEHAYPWMSSKKKRRYDDSDQGSPSFEDDDDDDRVLPDWVPQRSHSIAGDKNSRITKYLSELEDWWEHGTLSDQEKREYANRIPSLCRVTPLIRAWPVQLTERNWNTEKRKLMRQAGMAERTSSKSGGYIKLVEYLVCGGTNPREDTQETWALNPERKAVREIKKLKLGIRRHDIIDLVRGPHKVKGADDLYARKDTIFQGPLTKFGKFIPFARVGPSAIPMDQEETNVIVDKFQAIARQLNLAIEVVGSYRRGKIGGHDLDFLFCPGPGRTMTPDDVPAQIELDAAAREKVMEQIHLAYGVNLTSIVGAGHGNVSQGVTDRLLTSHVVIASPKIIGAYRHIDLVLCAASLWPHAILQWSGSRTFIRCFNDYVASLHERDHNNTPWQGFDERKGIKGWNLDGSPAENRIGPAIYGRRLDLSKKERWYWSSNGIFIVSGNRKAGNMIKHYEEWNGSFPDEPSIFRFFYLRYLPPHERCA